MAKAWMPGAERIDGGTRRTAVGIGAPRAVWTVTGTDPSLWSAREEALRMAQEGRAPHLVWNPLTGTVAQVLAATRRSGIVPGHAGQYGWSPDHGDEGRVCLVVAVVSTEKEPFTDGPLVGLAPILDWLGSWGVPERWPAGPPGVWGEQRPSSEEAARVWSCGGHFGHDQVPHSLATAPGTVDPERVLAPARREAVSATRSPAKEHHQPQPSVTI